MLRAQHLPLLAIFAQVCRDGSLTAAAQSLGLSKSVVSSHLRNLEGILDVRLLERTTRRLALTQAGDTVLAAANRMLAAQHSGAPLLPRQMSGDVKSCCLRQVQGVIVACALLEHQGRTVSLVVADGKDLCSRQGQRFERGGREFIAHQMNGLQMVMAGDGDRWLCVMGDVPPEQLVDLAAGVEF